MLYFCGMKKPRTHLVLGVKYDKMVEELVADAQRENPNYCQTDLFRDLLSDKYAELKARAMETPPATDCFRVKVSTPIEWTHSI